jgi:Spy/CpxP family protein refolding chaperone
MDNSQGSVKAIALVALVFVLGAGLGSAGTYVVTSRVHAEHAQAPPPHNQANTMSILTRDLDLNADQQKQIYSILGDTRARYAEIHKRDDPEYERTRQEGRDRIRQLLTPDQRPKFESILRRFDEERRLREREGKD